MEAKPMETGKGTVTVEALAKDLQAAGHVAVDGIYFDTDRAEIKARAVAQALVQRFGIDVKCLTAKGVGTLAPVASNDQESGRAKNRRGALVKQ